MNRGRFTPRDGFVWRDSRIVNERVSALETLRLGRAEIADGSVWTSRVIRDDEAVEPARFGLGERGDVLLRYYRISALLRTRKREWG